MKVSSYCTYLAFSSGLSRLTSAFIGSSLHGIAVFWVTKFGVGEVRKTGETMVSLAVAALLPARRGARR